MIISGYLCYSKTKNVKENEKNAFEITLKSVKTEIGVLLGGNAKNALELIKEYSDRSFYFPFEITDTPLDTEASVLLLGDHIEYMAGTYNLTPDTSLKERLDSISSFFKYMLELRDVKQIILNIDNDFEYEDDVYEIKPEDFSVFMLNKYREQNNMISSLNIIIYQ